MLDDICIILSGPNLGKNTLISNVKHYKNNNIKNIIISSYSDFSFEDDDVIFIKNDEYYPKNSGLSMKKMRYINLKRNNDNLEDLLSID
jgi:restriction endonuclease S subunit